MTVGRIGVPLAIRHAEAKRCLMGAIPSLGFNGLPGETSHHSSSSSSAPIAKSEIARCPPCAGLNDPPSKPRSEEHTSELQSPMRISYAVFCLKNTNKY